MRYSALLFLKIVTILFVFSTVTPLIAADQPTDGLTKRVQAVWEAKVNKEWGKVYDLAVSAYKQKVKRNEFEQKANLDIRDFSLAEVTVIEPEKKARAAVKYKVLQRGYEFDMTSEEEWLWENNDWYLNLLPSLQFPGAKPKKK